MLRKYYVTIVFTLLALLNLLSSWGTLQYRLVMLAFNLVCGFGMEYLVNKKASAEKYNLWKGCTAAVLLAVNLLWIFLTK
ncbi:hypothetical protein [Lactobacillus delbrueckii]|uniref:hypothetical protein n=1 Tax=Lactobacillus delbrueckii TaxID=1584 RepID=UPI001F279443|nr:hypothetical protein [Lactobacillus delbrueckii]GHN36406.1 hypothetical protein ME792_15320 [Lactobacillus delbrueckii]